ncbi:hypothetical protein thalar_03010 [Litoreibacter arenae DSM 19593]|uniref:Uncharacterized protein n=1 Tax=Litoreibacter arenae DSM 19593 TaxID=1123360 RepID=S9QCF9_9RHOB|nr:hypothetical protein thalar_03010 [Litoreibacter arenae DSM 19593]
MVGDSDITSKANPVIASERFWSFSQLSGIRPYSCQIPAYE